MEKFEVRYVLYGSKEIEAKDREDAEDIFIDTTTKEEIFIGLGCDYEITGIEKQ